MNKSATEIRRKGEIAAVLITAVGKFVFMDALQWRLPFILITILGWSFYVILHTQRVPGILKHWGFRFDNFWPVVKRVLPFGVVSLAAFFFIGFYQNSLNLTWHIFPVLLLYPVWGIVQQFLVIAIVAGNLKEMKRKLPDAVIIILTAILFGALHYPYYWLIAGTFVLALFYGYIYLQARNIFVLGIFHGWLGAVFFYTVVGRDPFMEVFGKFLWQE